jgi:hypothetical protein
LASLYPGMIRPSGKMRAGTLEMPNFSASFMLSSTTVLGVGILKKGEGFFADNGLCLIVGCRVAFQGIKLDIKRNILSFLYDLLHLLMKFGTVRSVRVIEGNDPDFRFRVPHHQGILKGNMGDIDPIQVRKPFLGQIFLLRDGYEAS